jgi:putative hydrolase of the HAD superfamily
VKPICVAFDLDDTLYLERDYVRSGFNELDAWVNTNLGLRGFGPRAWALFERGERKHIFDRTLLEAGVKPNRDMIVTMVDLYRNHFPHIQMPADADDCLRGIQGLVHVALVSDGPERTQKNKIRALGLGQTFETAVFTSTLGIEFSKPHPKAFLEVQKHFDQTIHKYIYVADNPSKDFQGPRSLGWKTVRVRRREGLYSSLEADLPGSPDFEVPDLSGVIDMIVGKDQADGARSG